MHNCYRLWQNGVLSKLLMKDSSHGGHSLKGTSRWFVLEGNLSTAQFESLLSCVGPLSSINLSSGRTIQLSDSVRFILEVSLYL